MELTPNHVAEWLLRERFLLTALELNAELLEAGQPSPILHAFFSNPSNFDHHDALSRSPSIVSYEFGDVHAGDSQPTQADAVSTRTEAAAAAVAAGTDDAVEARCLGFLVYKFLQDHGFKLTAVTFADENQSQDVDDWDDVGLNTARIPNLEALYQEFVRHRSEAAARAEAQATPPPAPVPMPPVSVTPEPAAVASSSTDQAAAAPLPPPCAADPRQRPCAFRTVLYQACGPPPDTPLAQNIARARGCGGVSAAVLCRSVARIAPFVAAHRREELLPMLALALLSAGDARHRESLFRLLFGLVARPSAKQRQAIVLACTIVANKLGTVAAQEEALPHLLESLNHQCPERRALAAEMCGGLAGYVTAGVCSSLLLSALQQLLDDSSELVRVAVVRALALLVAHMDNGDKYSVVEGLALRCLGDRADGVRVAARHILLPVVAQWASELDCLVSRLCPALLKAVSLIIKTRNGLQLSASDQTHIALHLDAINTLVPFLYAYTLRSAPASGVHDLEKRPVHREFETRGEDVAELDDAWIAALENPEAADEPDTDDDGADDQTAVLRQGALLLSSATLLGPSDVRATLHERVDAVLVSDDATVDQWPALAWAVHQWMPALVRLPCELDVRNTTTHAVLVKLIHTVCETFGPAFARASAIPIFEHMFSDGGAASDRQRMLPEYAEVMRMVSGGAFASTAALLQKIMGHMAKGGHGWTFALGPVVDVLCRGDEEYVATMVQLGWETVTQASPVRRSQVAEIVKGVLPHCTGAMLRDKVLSLVITLSNDADLNVRLSVIPCFGLIMQSTSNTAVLDKVKLQLDTYLGSDEPELWHAYTLHVSAMFADLMSTSNLPLTNFMLARVAAISERMAHEEDDTQVNTDICRQLLRVCHVFSDRGLRDTEGRTQLLAALQALNLAAHHLSSDDEEVLIALLSEHRAVATAVSENVSTAKDKLLRYFQSEKDADPTNTSTNSFSSMFRKR